uniref:Organic solute carrier partner 1a n=1 Tax=Sinocyclocheilus anshuiensis TaxID=1608454 RepID=A0A671KFI3_9TELE
ATALLIINLGGEVIYILDQRLRAQDENDDKTQRVMNDIVGTMFNKAFLGELLRPQDLYSHRALRTVLTQIAHASIMRLNPASMDKFYLIKQTKNQRKRIKHNNAFLVFRNIVLTSKQKINFLALFN